MDSNPILHQLHRCVNDSGWGEGGR